MNAGSARCTVTSLWFLGLAVLLALSAEADEARGKPFRIGVVSPALPRSAPQYIAFDQRLRELGQVEGRSATVEFVTASGDMERYPAVMADLVRRGVDVIVAPGPELALKAAEEATAKVPIVMVAIDYDPLARGHIASLAHPGGNVTGVFLQQLELTAKRLELLSEAVPRISRLLVLWDAISADQFKAAETAAASLRIPLEPVELTDLPYDFERALGGADGARGEALMVMNSPLLSRDAARVPELALRHRLPSIFGFKGNADAGGLMSYAPSLPEMFRLAAGYVDKIAKGAKPEDLPVEQPTKFELVVNLKTAKALGLTIPPFMLARADEVIE